MTSSFLLFLVSFHQTKHRMLEVTLSRIEHKGAIRIKVAFPFDQEIIDRIKTIPDSKWSQSKKCWHLPYTTETYRLLKIHYEINISEEPTDISTAKKPIPTKFNSLSKSDIAIPIVEVLAEHAYRVKVIVPPGNKDFIAKIKSLPNRAWNAKDAYWSVPKTQETLDRLHELFGSALKVASNIEWGNTSRQHKKVYPKEIVIEGEAPTSESKVKVNTNSTRHIPHKVIVGTKLKVKQDSKEWLSLFVPYDKKGWIAVVKNIPGRKWDVDRKCWLVPYVKDSLTLLDKYIGPIVRADF